MLNCPSSVNNNAINRLPQMQCNVLLDAFPTVTETKKANQQPSSGIAPGTYAIPAQAYKAGKLLMAKNYDDALTELVNHYANRTIIVFVLGIAPKSRAKVCAQWRILKPPGSLLATDRSKAVVWCCSY